MMAARTTWLDRLRGGMRGASFGVLAGALWALGEWGVNWVGGAVAPMSTMRLIGVLDLAFGAGVGFGAGLIVPRAGASSLALVLTLAYAFARTVAPPGVGAEIGFLAGAALVLVAVAWRGRQARGGALAFVHVVLLGALGLLLGELWFDARHTRALHGVWLPAVALGLPLTALLADGIIGRLVRSRGVRLAVEVMGLGLLAAYVGTPLDVRPLEDHVVTGVPPPAESPDVVLISLDTTRADRLSTYGYERETSPNLTRLAADGELYRVARSPAGWTLPAHASMMTGLFPGTHGAHLAGGFLPGESVDARPQVAYPLKAEIATLAEMLRDRGYHTGAFVANFSYLYRDYGLAQGFGIYDDAPGLLLRVYTPMARLVQHVKPSFCRKPFRAAREINQAALAWLDGRPAGRPAFLFVNYMEPHQPWIADAPYDRWAAGLPRATELAHKNLYTHAVRPLDSDAMAFIGAHYDGQVAAMDAALGELLEALRARGRYENTLVIVTGDHGELLGEHGQIGHMGRMLYEPLLRVPLVVKRPGSSRPRAVIDTPVQLVDLLPTVAEIVGVAAPDGIEGLPLDAGARPAYAEDGINPFLVERYGAFYDRAIRVLYDGTYKLISTSRGERMLFDLAVDPAERVDLAAREPERVQELSQRLELRTPHWAAAEPREKVR